MKVWRTPAVRLIRATGRAYLRPFRDARDLVRAGLQKICPTAGSTGVNVIFGALLVAVVFCAGVVADMRTQPATIPIAQTYQTALGETRQTKLADGSDVHLAPLTELTIDLSDDVRRVALIRGEAYFDVRHDEKRPFEVKAGDVVLRDIGTQFSVRTFGDGRFEVMVAEGVVGLSLHQSARKLPGSQGQRLLRAGDAAVLKGNVLRTRRMTSQEIDTRLAWRKHWLTFEDEPLAEVVEDLNRFSARRIVIADPSIEGVPVVGASFSADQIDRFLKQLSRKGVRFETVDQGGGVEEIHLFKPQEVWMQRRDPLSR